MERKLWTQYWNHHVVSHESCLCLLEECLIFSLLDLVWSGSGFSTEKNIWLVQLISLSVLLQTEACTVGCRSFFTGNGCLLWTETTPWEQTNCELEMTVEFYTAEQSCRGSDHSLKCHCYNPFSLSRCLHVIIWLITIKILSKVP